jgi:hypothetical protein
MSVLLVFSVVDRLNWGEIVAHASLMEFQKNWLALGPKNGSSLHALIFTEMTEHIGLR